MRALPFTVLVALIALSGPAARAQTGGATQPAAPTDTATVRRVMAAVYGTLGHHLAQATTDTVTRPWLIRLPTPDSVPWIALRAYILQIVRGRVATDRDASMFTLSIERPAMRGDTLVGEFYLGSRWRCPQEWKGDGTMYEVRAVRHGTSWAEPRTSAIGFGDSGPCYMSVPPLAEGNHTFTLQHGERTREYILHVPRAASSGRPLPVVLAFHGGGGEAAGFQAYAGLDAVADREGFLVVYPNGTGVLPRRLLTWNAGDCCGYAMNQRVDDVGFAIAVLDDVANRTAVNADRVYATGHSNGAMMVYRLAAERADRIAAIVPVGGAYDMERFAPSRPVAVLHIHSVDDPRALYAGGVGPPFPGTNVRSSHRPVTGSINRWVTNNKCRTPARTTESRTGRAGSVNAGQTATLLTWDGCAAGGNVAHWKLTGAGHGWPGRAQPQMREELIGPSTTLVDAAEEVWKFVATIRR